MFHPPRKFPAGKLFSYTPLEIRGHVDKAPRLSDISGVKILALILTLLPVGCTSYDPLHTSGAQHDSLSRADLEYWANYYAERGDFR